VLSQSSYYSCNNPRLHIGLGACNTADVDIYWPIGLRESYKGLAANQLVTLREGVGRVTNKGWDKRS